MGWGMNTQIERDNQPLGHAIGLANEVFVANEFKIELNWGGGGKNRKNYTKNGHSLIIIIYLFELA
jgi:hypothetical protein